MSNMREIVLGITGASGTIYAEHYIRGCTQMRDISLSVILTETARTIWLRELGYDPEELISECGASILPNDSFDAPFCSGSAAADTLLILPCSMGALARIAGGLASDAISRIADVQLKERKQLIIVPRETPLNLIHLQNMQLLTQAGAVICPASPSFYHNPATIDDLADSFIGRLLNMTGVKPLEKKYQWNNNQD